MNKMTEEQLEQLAKLRAEGKTWDQIAPSFPGHTANALRKTFYRNMEKPEKLEPSVEVKKTPRILVVDIETSPVLGYFWQLFDQNIALNQIKQDWYILSWAAKWLGDPEEKVMYMDQRNAKNIEDDSEILGPLWKLLDEADFLLGQNLRKFDQRKINARFIHNGYAPPSSYRVIDTMEIAKARFGFTSNKLEYMSDKLCVKYKKLKHDEFSGFTLWSECLKGNLDAFKSMEKYNCYDILSTEELYLKLRPWDRKGPNLNLFNEDTTENVCSCGSIEFNKNGFVYSNTGKFQRYVCKKCGAETRDKQNLLSKEKRKSLRSN